MLLSMTPLSPVDDLATPALYLKKTASQIMHNRASALGHRASRLLGVDVGFLTPQGQESNRLCTYPVLLARLSVAISGKMAIWYVFCL
jgi:hypothetical protein